MFPELFDHSQAEDVGYLCVHRETGGQDVSILFVYFGPTFDLGHNHSHDASSVGGSEGEELLVGGDVLIPWVWVLDWEPITTEQLNAIYVIVAEEAELDFTEGCGRHHVTHSHLVSTLGPEEREQN